jgi:DNA-binding response OmpR family regulator
MRALIIEDDPQLREQVCRHLSDEGYAVDAAADGEQGQYMALEYPLDLAIIDLGLPKTPGIAIIKAVRRAGRSFPILILTARQTIPQRRAAGAGTGAGAAQRRVVAALAGIRPCGAKHRGKKCQFVRRADRTHSL